MTTAEAKLIDRYKRACGLLFDTVAEYADPEFYHAVAFLADRPAGGFADDFSRTKHPYYNRAMPGKNARRALKQLERQFGELSFYTLRDNEQTPRPTGDEK